MRNFFLGALSIDIIDQNEFVTKTDESVSNLPMTLFQAHPNIPAKGNMNAMISLKRKGDLIIAARCM